MFGVPENKVEALNDDRAWVCQAFPDRAEAKAHVEAWGAQLERWQGGRSHRFEWSCDGCSVRLLVPLNWAVHYNAQELAYQRELWPAAGSGPCHWVERFQFETNVKAALGYLCSGGTELMLPGGMVRPFVYFFTPERQKSALVKQAYYEGVPDVLVEVLTPANVRELRGNKLRFYRETGVPEVWLVDPDARTVEVLRLFAGRYALEGRYGEGEPFVSMGRSVKPALLFEGTVHPARVRLWPAEEGPVGIQDFLVGGIPRGSYEFYHGVARRVLVWESVEEAEDVASLVLREMAAWSGPFRLSREGSVICLEVTVDVGLHRRFLEYWHFSGNWRD